MFRQKHHGHGKVVALKQNKSTDNHLKPVNTNKRSELPKKNNNLIRPVSSTDTNVDIDAINI